MFSHAMFNHDADGLPLESRRRLQSLLTWTCDARASGAVAQFWVNPGATEAGSELFELLCHQANILTYINDIL